MSGEYIIGWGTERDPQALKLETRKRRFINNVVQVQRDPAAMKDAVKIHVQNYKGAVRAISANSTYNCYGMVFAARRTAIADSVDVEAIFQDDEYKVLPNDPSKWRLGDIAVYRDAHRAIQHVGVIAVLQSNVKESTFDVMVLSTWGQDGEYLHPIHMLPVRLGKLSEVRSQRFLP